MKKKIILLYTILFQYSLFSIASDDITYRNIAYVDSHVRFTVISEGTIRLEYAADGKFVDLKSFLAVNRTYSHVNYRIKERGSWIKISTSEITLKYKKDSGKFTAKNLSIVSGKGMFPVSWKPGIKQRDNLKGTFRTLDCMDGDVQTQSWLADTKKGEKLPIENGIVATDGWTLIDDSSGLLFDGDPEWDWVKVRSDTVGQDWYFMFYGHDYKKALKDYTLFAGKIPLPPRYAFGYWWSRDWAYSDSEIRRLIDNFHTYRIPLDVLVLDMDWHYTRKGEGGWTGWTWNNRLFPDPCKFLAYLKKNNLKVTLNIHPCDGVPAYDARYRVVAEDLGIDPHSKKKIPWSASDKKFMEVFFKDIIMPLEKEGVDFWWPDWQQSLYDTKIPQLKNTWWINYMFFSHAKKCGFGRPLLYHRWSGLGNHRYQIGFSGDAIVSWKSLDYQPYFNSTSSNVLYGYWSHDLGGYLSYDHKLDPELYIRWLQFGGVSPIMRTHATKEPSLDKAPWAFDQQDMQIIRETICRRYNMVPYIYTMARKAYDDGISLCRPLYYAYPENKESYSFRDEYMFGDKILIAPITAPSKDGYSTLKVWLPAGEWYEWSTGTLLKGGRTIERSFALDEYPLYVKSGSVLPMYTGDVQNLSGNDEPVAVTVFPGKNGSSFNMYEDNGNDKNYSTEYATTLLTSERRDNKLIVTIGNRKGAYKDMPGSRRFTVKVLASDVPISVTVNGNPASYRYVGNELATLVDLRDSSCNSKKRIEITYASAQNSMSDGILGEMRRINKSFEQLKVKEPGIAVNGEFGPMGEVGDAIMYHPKDIKQLLEAFRRNYGDLPEVLKRQELKEEDIRWFLQSIQWRND